MSERRRPAAGRRPVAPHGRRRQVPAPARRPAAAGARDRARCGRRSAPWCSTPTAIPARFAAFGLPVVADTVPGFAGPLAGILAGLEWAAAHRPGCAVAAQHRHRHAVLSRATSSRACSAAVDGGGRASSPAPPAAGRAHPVFGLWPVRAGGRAAPRAGRGGHAQDRLPGPRAIGWPRSSSRPTPFDPVLQRQPARGPGRGRAAAGQWLP